MASWICRSGVPVTAASEDRAWGRRTWEGNRDRRRRGAIRSARARCRRSGTARTRRRARTATRRIRAPDVDRVPRHVRRRAGVATQRAASASEPYFETASPEQLLLVRRGPPAAVDVELDPVGRGIGCGLAQRPEERGIEVGYTRNCVVEYRRAAGTAPSASPSAPLCSTAKTTDLAANGADGRCGRRGRGRHHREDAAEDEDASNWEPRTAAITATTTSRPAARIRRVRIRRGVARARVAVGHASSQGGAVLPARMWFSIRRRYAAALASEHARVDRRGRALHGGSHPRRPPPGSDRGRHRR